jgi:hypothetical protein
VPAYEKGRRQISALKNLDLITSAGINGDEQAAAGPGRDERTMAARRSNSPACNNVLSGSGPLTSATEKAPMTSSVTEPPSRETPLDYACSDSSSSGDNMARICKQNHQGAREEIKDMREELMP